MKQRMTRITIRVSDEEWRRLKDLSAERGESMSKMLRDKITRHVDTPGAPGPSELPGRHK
jgi:predicted DNA-binding protein